MKFFKSTLIVSLFVLLMSIIPASAGDTPFGCPDVILHTESGKVVLQSCYWIPDTEMAVVGYQEAIKDSNILANTVGIAMKAPTGEYIMSSAYASSNGPFGVTITSEGNVFLGDQTWGKFYFFQQDATAQDGWSRSYGSIDSVTKVYSGDEIALRTAHDWACPSLANQEKGIFSGPACYWLEDLVFVNTYTSDNQFFGTWFDVRGVDTQIMTASSHVAPPTLGFPDGKLIMATTEFTTQLHISETSGRLVPAS